MPDNIESKKYFTALGKIGSTNIFDGAKEGIASGINICRRAVEGTIGGKGTNAIIKQEFYPYYIQTKDAFSIIQSIKCEDPLQILAVDMMKDATDSMNKRSKDGRTTMTILTDEILKYALKSGKNGLEVEKELSEMLPLVEALVDEKTRPIDVEEVEAVATTASDSTRLGRLISGIYKQAGKDCMINHIEASGTWEDEVILTEGVRFIDTGLLSPVMVHDEEAKKEGRAEKRAVYYKPSILVTKRKISTDMDIAPLIESLLSKGKKDLIIFTDDMDSTVATNLINTHKAGIMNICIIKAPVLWKNHVFEDFAKVTGSTILEDATGVNFKNLAFDHLGTCGKIVVDKEETVITGIADITDHIEELRKQDTEDAKLRLWWLTTKSATIRLGATNEGELSFLRLKAEDAIHSSQLALQGGVVEGGGKCLYEIADNENLPGIREVFRAPLRQIAKNAGAEEESFKNQIPYNILDAAIVVKNGVRNAIGIASRVLTTNVFLDLPKKTPEEIQLEILQNKRTPF